MAIPVFIEPHFSLPFFHRDDMKIQRRIKLIFQITCNLCYCHTMTDRQGTLSDKRSECHIKHRPFRNYPAKRIRPVQNNNRFPRFHACLHAKFHCPNEGIIAGTDILHINCDHVNIFQHRRGRFACTAVKAVNRESGLFILEPSPLDHVILCLSANPMLRTKKRSKFELAAF